ncbi:MAG: excinuclease ABC subunit UvrA [Bacteroidia bacterium]|nr:excinuclease ABC subunit UvrA [Bacteroidia bacterium]
MNDNILYHESEYIQVTGARAHNLKNVDITIPRNQLVVITGLSGSGKSSLAFDTIYAEGQRRYMESFSIYARQFLGTMQRPEVDKITGLSPVIAIEQKTTSKNPRSTVGTITEIYDFLRLLYARAGEAYSYVTGEKMVRYTDEQIITILMEHYQGQRIAILAPLVKGRKGHYRELFEQIRKWGFLRVRIDGQIKEIAAKQQLDRYKIHDIEVVVDRLEITEDCRTRLTQTVQTAMKYGKGSLMVVAHDDDKAAAKHFSRFLMCPTSGVSYDEPAPNLFSFNSPYGACDNCNGLGTVTEIDIKKIIPLPKLSIAKGGLAPLGTLKVTYIFKLIEAVLLRYDYTLNTPIEELSEHVVNILLYGSDELFRIKTESSSDKHESFMGIVNFLKEQFDNNDSKTIEKWVQAFMNDTDCPTCKGNRLKNQSLNFKIADQNIAQLSKKSLEELALFFEDVESRLTEKQNAIAKEVLKEIRARLGFLLDVGLNYLSLYRSSKSLSGGEAQRIRLATQIGSKLVGVLYILDEPSIGLHQRDNVKLIKALQDLRDAGNSVLVVEHDKDMILAADHVIDVGPYAGIHGGHIVAQGTPAELLGFNTLTTQYINGLKKIELPTERRKGNGKELKLIGAKGHNLNNVSVTFPLGTFICVTGVSGSGKSSLINGTLYPILMNYFYKSGRKPLPYDKIEGIGNLDKIIEINQSPIGRTPRSNPSTYTDIFGPIRDLFSSLPEASIRGYKPGRFSFNVKGGRCETCTGAGLRTIEMNFLPDVYVTCESCNGKRYNRETLEIRYRGKSIADVLDMTVSDATVFFENLPNIQHKIKMLNEVGLGYIKLGQQSTTLSGGEAQRVKLAAELCKKDTGNTIYLLDEPTTGLHFEDIRILLEVLQRLVTAGNTLIVIEHNMDIIKVADHIIDVGEEGGKNGGNITFTGTPEELIKNKKSHTAKFLKLEM